MDDRTGEGSSLDAGMRKRLEAVRAALLHLHKLILEVERAAYEKVNGRIESPHQALQLVMFDPWFGWFRPISEIAVRLDELLDDDRGRDADADARDLLRELRSLLNPAEEGEEFAVKYRDILQSDPAIILAHANIRKWLEEDGE